MTGRRIFTASLLTAGALFAQSQQPSSLPFIQEETSFRIATGTPPDRLPIVPELEVKLTLQHSGAQPLDLTFPSGQDFDINLWNSQGEAIYTWSANKLFPAVFRNIKFTGKRTWTASIPLVNLPAGKYVVDGWLTTREPKTYRALIQFEIKGAQP